MFEESIRKFATLEDYASTRAVHRQFPWQRRNQTPSRLVGPCPWNELKGLVHRSREDEPFVICSIQSNSVGGTAEQDHGSTDERDNNGKPILLLKSLV